LIDQEKKELSIIVDNKPPVHIYSDIPPDYRVFCCTADNVCITFTRHIIGRGAIERYLKNPITEYNPSEWELSEK
jgi:hypothetical protein